MKRDIGEHLAAIKAGTRGLADYVSWLESELRSSRQELERVLSERATDLPAMGVHTGLTSRVRVILRDGPMTFADLTRRLDSDGVRYQRKSLSVILATGFEHTPPAAGKRTGGVWSLRTEQAA